MTARAERSENDPAQARVDAEIAARYAAAHDEAGIDLTQIDWMLSLSAAERLEALLVHTRSIERLLADARRD